MNKAMMKIVTRDLMLAASAALLAKTLSGKMDIPEVIKDRLIYIGMMRWHGLITDEWILASLARQHSFAMRDFGDDKVTPLKEFQSCIMKILEASAESYQLVMVRDYAVDLAKQPKFDTIIGKDTHDALARIAAA